MKKLLLTTLMGCGMIPLATACGGTDACPDDPAKLDPGICGCGVPDADFDVNGTIDCQEVNGTISSNWTLVSGDNNDVTGCPAGVSTVALVAQDSFGEQFTDLYDCAAGGGTTAPLLADNYLVWLQLTDSTGELLYAQSLSTDVTVAAGANTPVSFEVSVDRGAFYLSWEIYEAGALSDCASVGGAKVSVLSTDANNEPLEDQFDCTDGGGNTAGLALGPYSESVSLLDDAQLALVVADPVEASLEYGNHYYDLGLFILDTAAP